MEKYFIKYHDLMKDNKIKKYYDIYSPEVFIMNKNKKGTFNFVPILFFSDYDKNLYFFSDKLKESKEKELVVELNLKQARLFCDKNLLKCETTDGKNYELLVDELKNIKLINYGLINDYSINDLNDGTLKLVVMKPDVDKKYMYVSTDKNILAINTSIKERRSMLNHSGINCDLYFQTEDENLLKKYKENVIELEEEGNNIYKIIKQKVFVIDSISSDRLYNLSKNNYECLNGFMYDAVPVSITEEDDKYDLEINHNVFNRRKGKGYIINYDIILKYIYNPAFQPFIKYFNVYNYDNGLYKRMSFNDYLEKNDILKYIKKPKN